MAAEAPAGDSDGNEPPMTSNEGGEEGPRVRSYFPETLLVEPALITDSDGTAQIDVTMADSITTWRLTGMASSQSGQLGSSSEGILVFQPFFVEIDFPLSLTQNDELDVPVAVFNFLDTAQEVTLTVDSDGSWYELLSSESQVVSVEAGEVMSTSFRVRVNEVGYHTFTVSALGGDFPDAVERAVQVLPDGEEVIVAVSDRLEEDTSVLFSIPEIAIENASGLLVKIYPGMFSQVVEGLDSLLAMPSGCFEQTSSSTYPNVLALNYLRQTDQSSPEIEETALSYIVTGYQRLLSYEVEGGGFEWFGNAPAHRILTAYGLLEFDDMSAVYEIDPELIPRTQDWLISQQESDGRFRAAPEGIHEGATNNFTDSDLRATAYIAYSLAESGYTGSAIDSAISWIKGDMAGIEDNYTLALIANLLIAHSPSDSELNNILSILSDNAQIEEDSWYWGSDSTSLTYGSGDGMTMETTALVLYAMIQSGSYPAAVEGGMRYLIRNKDTFGTWSSTQATILSLRAFIASLNGAAEPADAIIGISGNEVLAASIEVDDFNADVMQQVDLTETLLYGDNQVDITFDGEGSFLYQVVGRYYIPWTETEDESSALTLQLTYPDEILATGEPVTVKATVGNNQIERAEMLMLKIGTPPGFDVDLRTLENHVSSGLFSRVDRIGNRIDAYLYGLDGETSVDFEFDLVPRFPMEVQTPHSEMYLYYNPEIRAESEPVTVVVQ
jgi:VCBS repeat-containing protein